MEGIFYEYLWCDSLVVAIGHDICSESSEQWQGLGKGSARIKCLRMRERERGTWLFSSCLALPGHWGKVIAIYFSIL